MTSKIFTFILGLLVGAVVCAAVFSRKSLPPTPAAVTATDLASKNEIAGLKSQLLDAKSRLEKAHADNEKLAARVQELLKQKNAVQASADKPKRQNGFAALFGGDGTNGMSEVMGKMVKSVMEQQAEGKIAAMKAKLNLTPEQEVDIRRIMTSQMSRGTELAQKMMKGELTKEEMEKMGKQPLGEDAQIKALLTPGQVTAYDEYQKEEKTRMTRLVANSELMQMQSSLQLNEEQQDKVFTVLAEQAQTLFDPKGSNFGSGFDVLRDQAAKKAEALRGVLTPDQFERYQKFQEQQMRMIEAFMPKEVTNGDVRVTPVVSP